MSTAGNAKDACASRAKPRLEERVCEHGWRPTLGDESRRAFERRALRSARRRATLTTDTRPLVPHIAF